MNVEDFKETKRIKCSVCGQQITRDNVAIHVPCLESTHGFNGALSPEGLMGLFFQKGWITGSYGQDAQHTFFFFLKDLNGRLVTRDPVFRMVQYSLTVQANPAAKAHKLKGEVEPENKPETTDAENPRE